MDRTDEDQVIALGVLDEACRQLARALLRRQAWEDQHGVIPGRSEVEETQETSSPGATWGPWATHEPRCKCNVCR